MFLELDFKLPSPLQAYSSIPSTVRSGVASGKCRHTVVGLVMLKPVNQRLNAKEFQPKQTEYKNFEPN
jgi:hypothetical protein